MNFSTLVLLVVFSGLTQSVWAQDNSQPASDSTELIYTVVEVPAQFQGGFDALTKYVSQNIRYPKEARRAGIEGTVFVGFVINVDGSVTQVSVIN